MIDFIINAIQGLIEVEAVQYLLIGFVWFSLTLLIVRIIRFHM